MNAFQIMLYLFLFSGSIESQSPQDKNNPTQSSSNNKQVDQSNNYKDKSSDNKPSDRSNNTSGDASQSAPKDDGRNDGDNDSSQELDSDGNHLDDNNNDNDSSDLSDKDNQSTDSNSSSDDSDNTPTDSTQKIEDVPAEPAEKPAPPSPKRPAITLPFVHVQNNSTEKGFIKKITLQLSNPKTKKTISVKGDFNIKLSKKKNGHKKGAVTAFNPTINNSDYTQFNGITSITIDSSTILLPKLMTGLSENSAIIVTKKSNQWVLVPSK